MSSLHDLLADYEEASPSYRRLHAALTERDIAVVEDHIALRTLALPGIDMASIVAHLRDDGYGEPLAAYAFPDRGLRACYCRGAEDAPRIFISELDCGHLGAELAQELIESIGDAQLQLPGRPWQPRFSTYRALRAVSEYAAWFLAFGWRVNHRTLAMHAMPGCATIEDALELVHACKLPINAEGGVIKGSNEQGLRQASILADAQTVDFADGQHQLPGVYVEFAERHQVDGVLFDGFIAASARHIFTSTDPQAAGE